VGLSWPRSLVAIRGELRLRDERFEVLHRVPHLHAPGPGRGIADTGDYTLISALGKRHPQLLPVTNSTDVRGARWCSGCRAGIRRKHGTRRRAGPRVRAQDCVRAATFRGPRKVLAGHRLDRGSSGPPRVRLRVRQTDVGIGMPDLPRRPLTCSVPQTRPARNAAVTVSRTPASAWAR
jgi:hypothetical protein